MSSTRAVAWALALAAAWRAVTAVPVAVQDTSKRLTSLVQTADGAPHHWPHVRGNVGSYGTTPLVGPVDLNASFAWSFHHPDGRYHSVMLGGAVIDREKNIYVSTDSGIFKLSPQGHALWHYDKNVPYSTVPSLMGDALYGSSGSGWYFALDLATGSELWNQKLTTAVSGDTSYVEAHNGVVVAGARGELLPECGNWALIGINATTGDKLWEYTALDERVWNVMAVFPDDDTAIFMDLTGGVYRVGLHNGSEIWAARMNSSQHASFSDGGLILGPDGDVYTCSNPPNGHGNEGEAGVLRKFALADGQQRWETLLPYPCNSWPAVSADGSTVVVVPGSFNANAPTLEAAMIAAASNNYSSEELHEFLTEFHNNMKDLGIGQRAAAGMPNLRAAIMAFDTASGEELWRHDVIPWGELASAGDEEGYLTRASLGHRTECLPAHWSSPTIDASGAVYVGRTDGRLYRYSPGTGEANYMTGAGPLHSGSTFAPGVMAYTDCDSLYVFNM